MKKIINILFVLLLPFCGVIAAENIDDVLEREFNAAQQDLDSFNRNEPANQDQEYEEPETGSSFEIPELDLPEFSLQGSGWKIIAALGGLIALIIGASFVHAFVSQKKDNRPPE